MRMAVVKGLADLLFVGSDTVQEAAVVVAVKFLGS